MSALNYTHTVGWIFIKQQQSSGKYVAQLRHIILIPSQSVFDLTPFKYTLLEKRHIPISLLFGLTPPFLELKIYSIRGTHNNNYNTNADVNALVSTLTLEYYTATLFEVK
jgi:hypothetical protein